MTEQPKDYAEQEKSSDRIQSFVHDEWYDDWLESSSDGRNPGANALGSMLYATALMALLGLGAWLVLGVWGGGG